jgi:molybdopterin synthase sulfur carrier subunit
LLSFMSLKIIMFGRLADIAGNAIAIDDVADTDSLVNELNKKYPALSNAKFVIAVNKKIIKKNTPINSASVVALLPPFSGG